MDTRIHDVYLHEIEAQCQFALNAIEQLNSAMAHFSQAPPDMPSKTRRLIHAEVFRGIHSFLTHVSNVSRLLWPPLPQRRKNESDSDYVARYGRLKRVTRATILRGKLGLPEEDHPLKSRVLRDHLEHFDERLDDWEETSPKRNYVQDFIGPRGSIRGISATDMMRWFDPTTGSFIFRGEEYSLQALASAVDELIPVVRQSLSNPAYAESILREDAPDLLHSWENYRSEVFKQVVGDPRLNVSDVSSIYFHPYGVSADVKLGHADTAQEFSMRLPEASVPGPKAQTEIVADAIVTEILARKQRLSSEPPAA